MVIFHSCVSFEAMAQSKVRGFTQKMGGFSSSLCESLPAGNCYNPVIDVGCPHFMICMCG